jgi:hypothetical protein
MFCFSFTISNPNSSIQSKPGKTEERLPSILMPYIMCVSFSCSLLIPVIKPFNAGIKSLRGTLPDEIFLLWILLLEPCISLMYA